MYHSFDDEVFLAPESIISGVLETALFDDEPDLADVGAGAPPRHAADDDGDDVGTGDAAGDGFDRRSRRRVHADPIEAWSRRARGASGFGG